MRNKGGKGKDKGTGKVAGKGGKGGKGAGKGGKQGQIKMPWNKWPQ